MMATFVLVHGTTAGGWVWKDVAVRLRAAGHTVLTPTLTGLGERVHLLTPDVGLDTHITDVVNVLLYEDLRDVVLVGHSHAGMVITGVAEQVPERIARLVYLDAIVPENGESSFDCLPPRSQEEMNERVRTQGDGWLVPVMRGPNDLPAKNTPHPWKSWTDPLRLENPAAPEIPCAYVRFTADKQPGSFFQSAMETSWRRAQARGWSLYEVDTVHQILPDPEPKAAALLSLLSDDSHTWWRRPLES
jgi:pimeloyl-ACP methyl ester carboxylesterase